MNAIRRCNLAVASSTIDEPPGHGTLSRCPAELRLQPTGDADPDQVAVEFLVLVVRPSGGVVVARVDREVAIDQITDTAAGGDRVVDPVDAAEIVPVVADV